MKHITSVIIADLHLSNDYKAFTKFCTEIAPKYDNLYILGDLFNAYLGDDLIEKNYQKVIDLLQNLNKTTNVFVMHGNRDFLMGKIFARLSGAVLIKEPFIVGDCVLLHGDSLVTDDKKYQVFKVLIQNPLTKFILKNTTKSFRQKLVDKLRQVSNNSKAQKSLEIMDVNDKSVIKFMKKYPNKDLIHGHTHRKNIHNYEGFKRYVLGDWTSENGNYLQIVNGEITAIDF